ncbi:MAG: hypothetical protein LZF61_04410, partial [Nitrosomonas sp.]
MPNCRKRSAALSDVKPPESQSKAARISLIDLYQYSVSKQYLLNLMNFRYKMIGFGYFQPQK